MRRDGPLVRIWYLFHSPASRAPNRVQVPESEVPDEVIWYTDWSEMEPTEQTKHGHNHAHYRDVMKKQRG